MIANQYEFSEKVQKMKELGISQFEVLQGCAVFFMDDKQKEKIQDVEKICDGYVQQQDGEIIDEFGGMVVVRHLYDYEQYTNYGGTSFGKAKKAIENKGDLLIYGQFKQLNEVCELYANYIDELNFNDDMHIRFGEIIKIIDSSSFQKNGFMLIDRELSIKAKGSKNDLFTEKLSGDLKLLPFIRI
jgi:hypothetical protein